MPTEYYNNGNLRWSFFLENPNCAAAFLACILGWAFWLEATCDKKGKQHARYDLIVGLIYVFELAIWFLITKTYSRGGLVAATLGMLYFFALCPKEGRKMINRIGHIAARLTVVAVICVSTGFSSRISPSFIAQDNSALNRLDLWKGAMVMINDSPLDGWGHNLGGIAYVNWYQPLAAQVRPTGFVNSYLEIAVEYGLPILYFGLICICILLLFSIRLRSKCWVVAAGGSLTTWLICNFWSSLWNMYELWLLPGISIICLGAAGFGLKKNLVKIILYSTTIVTIITFTFIGFGRNCAKNMPFKAVPIANGDAAYVVKRMQVSPRQPSAELWVDSQILGRYWGRTLRELFGGRTQGDIVVYAPWANKKSRSELCAKKHVLFGFQAELLYDCDFDGKIVVVHPTLYPPDSGYKRPNVITCLPALSSSEYDFPWRIWTESNESLLILSPQYDMKIDGDQKKGFWGTLIYE